jgi:uncharacterized lipoprotein YajG
MAGMTGIVFKKMCSTVSRSSVTVIILSSLLWLSGCVTTSTKPSSSPDYIVYAETQRSISRDQTVTELACYNAVTEAMKSSDSVVKTTAMALLATCKKTPEKIEPPK